jgi:hypothetical protein
LLRKIFEVYYENDVTDLPYSPDVSDYLLSEVNLFLKLVLEFCESEIIPEGVNGAVICD